MTQPAVSAEPAAARERILGAALALFGRQGFAGTSTREVALAAGVQQGLLRYHFGSKEGLWRAVVDAGFARWRAAFAARVLPTPTEPRRRLHARLEWVLEVAATEPALVRLLCHEALCASPRLEWLVARQLAPLHAALQRELSFVPGGAALPSLDRQLLGWLASQVAFEPLHVALGPGAAARTSSSGGSRLASVWLAAWIDGPAGAPGAWSLAAARRRASSAAEGDS